MTWIMRLIIVLSSAKPGVPDFEFRKAKMGIWDKVRPLEQLQSDKRNMVFSST